MVFNNKTIITDQDLNNFEQMAIANQAKQKNLPKKQSRGAQMKEIEMINRIDNLIIGEKEEDPQELGRQSAIEDTIYSFPLQFF